MQTTYKNCQKYLSPTKQTKIEISKNDGVKKTLKSRPKKNRQQKNEKMIKNDGKMGINGKTSTKIIKTVEKK